jgi:ribosomal protein S10
MSTFAMWPGKLYRSQWTCIAMLTTRLGNAAGRLRTKTLRRCQAPPASTVHTHLTQCRNISEEALKTLENSRLPRNVQAVYLAPLRRVAEHGIPVCDLQLRSYSIRNLELMADFAMRAAYYLGIPAKGPIPLPRITERWTVPRGNFAHKKSMENFERITCRRMIQIQDADPEVVQIWLGYLQKRQYHGVGLKANIWEHEEIGVGKKMEAESQELLKSMKADLERYGHRKEADVQKRVEEILAQDHYKRAIDHA